LILELLERVEDAVRAGIDSIEHASLIDDEGIELAKQHGTVLVFDIYNDEYILAEGAKNGMLVAAVTDGSAGSRAGLKAGDVITTLNGARIRTVGELREKLSAKPDDKQVKLGVLRNKSEVTLTVELPERSSKVHRKTIARRTYI